MKIFEVNYIFPKDKFLLDKLLNKYNFTLVRVKNRCMLSQHYIVRKEDIVWLIDNNLRDKKAKLETSMIAKGSLFQLSNWLIEKDYNNVLVGGGF